MPAFAFAYGSFGDILATAELVIKIVILLPEQQPFKLKSLGADLANLTLIPVDDTLRTSAMAFSVAARIQEEVRRCLLILKFFEKINAPNGIIPRIIWAVSQDRELAAFRMRVVERRTALGVVVGMMNSGMLVAVQDRVDQVGAGNNQIRDVVHEDASSLAQQLATYQQQIVAVIRNISHGVSEETLNFYCEPPSALSIDIRMNKRLFMPSLVLETAELPKDDIVRLFFKQN
ncbi:hypothetical protein MVEN_00783900 [Mycena venus]|uniref:Uncharacterized protein n=1 Tax=Mycena venus TaxID=2733690 RepID=A0A8H6YLL0_9AGAR|nr:hypothetical protein MVEN_00783900 [Mycena venus]